jgi:protein-tyrosine phosphatase
MAEALLRHRLSGLGVDARVASAGLLRPGQPASEHGVDILRGRGLDMTSHRSQSMTRDLLRGHDLIIAMAREHVREAVVLDPSLWPRTFTLKELVRRGEAIGPRSSDLTGSSPADDVADPYGGPRTAYERMATELDDLLDRLVSLMFTAAMAPR